MTEQELIEKIKDLKQIKPREEWVVSCKSRVFEKETPVVIQSESESKFKETIKIISSAFRHIYKPAFVSAGIFGCLFGVFGLSQSALPGDALYSVRNISDQLKVQLAAEENKPKIQLEITSRKFGELAKIAEANLSANLAPAIQAVENSAKQSAKALNKIALESEDNGKLTKEIMDQIGEIEQKEKRMEQTLATEINTKDLEESFSLYHKAYIEQMIKDLENNSLTENQGKALEQAKESYEKGDFSEALIKAIEASQIK